MPSNWVWFSSKVKKGRLESNKFLPVILSHMGIHSLLPSTYIRTVRSLLFLLAGNVFALQATSTLMLIRLIMNYYTTVTFGQFRLLKTGIYECQLANPSKIPRGSPHLPRSQHFKTPFDLFVFLLTFLVPPPFCL